MSIKPKEQLYLPEDECLLDYERSVITIARRRIVKFLFRHIDFQSVAIIIRSTNISINALAAIYSELKERDYILYTEQGLSLTEKGRRWAVRERKSIFMRKELVRYKRPLQVGNGAIELIDSSRKLPTSYRFTWIDDKK